MIGINIPSGTTLTEMETLVIQAVEADISFEVNGDMLHVVFSPEDEEAVIRGLQRSKIGYLLSY